MLKKNYTILLGLTLIIFVLILSFSISVHTLELRSFANGQLVFKQRVSPGDKFILKYTHSVALTPVWEIFVIDNQYQIVLVETYFMDHGAGMPHTPFGQEIFIEEEGKFKIKNMHRIMPSPIYYRVGAIRENYFYTKDKEIDLSSLLGDKLLTISVYKRNLYNYIIGRNLDDQR